MLRQPLVATETLDKFDVMVNVHGGGYTGQAGAILVNCGIARALLQGRRRVQTGSEDKLETPHVTHV